MKIIDVKFSFSKNEDLSGITVDELTKLIYHIIENYDKALTLSEAKEILKEWDKWTMNLLTIPIHIGIVASSDSRIDSINALLKRQ